MAETLPDAVERPEVASRLERAAGRYRLRTAGWRIAAGVVIAVGGSVVATWLAMYEAFDRFSGLPFIVVIVCATIVGRLLAGALSVVLTAVLLDYYVLHDPHGFEPLGSRDLVAVVAFSLVALAVSAMLSRLERANQERRAAHERLRFLTRAGEILSSSLDHGVTLQRSADLAVERFGDWSVIHLVDDEDRIGTVAVASRDPDTQALVLELQEAYPPRDDDPIAIALRDGECLTMDITEDVIARDARDRRHAVALRSLAPRSAVIAPLSVGDRSIGALTVVSRQRHRYSEADVALVEALADRAALSLSNAELLRQAEAARGRVSLVSDVSELLAREIRYPAAFVRLAQLLTRRVTDIVLIDTLDPTGEIRRVVAMHGDRTKQGLVDILGRDYAPSPSGEHPVARVIRGGGPEHAERMEPEFLRRTTRDDRHLQIVTALGFQSFMCVPLNARGRILGTLTMVSTNPDRRYGPADVEVAMEIARRAAVRIDNARLYEEQRHIATTLQHSLLPRVLPEVPGIQVALRYWAQGEGTEVGGDFYDVFASSSDTWTVLIGDVCGKGAEAAALVGVTRHTARALASQGLRPATLLRELNGTLIAFPSDGQFCTVSIGRLRVVDASFELTIASGGHPPPFLVRADGTISPVESKGDLLGVFEDIVAEETTLALSEGDTVVFYTDGVLERPGGDTGHERDIPSLLAGAEKIDLEDLVDRVEDALEPGSLLDDAALVLLRVEGPPPSHGEALGSAETTGFEPVRELNTP